MSRKPIRQWRVSRAEPSGLHLWFDPMVEFPRLYENESPDRVEPPPGIGVQGYCERDDHTGPDGPDQVKVLDLFPQIEIPLDGG